MEIKFDGNGFNTVQQKQIRDAYGIIVNAANQALNTARTGVGNLLIGRWFDAGNAIPARRGINLFHKILTDPDRTITFVNMSSRQYWCALGEQGLLPPAPRLMNGKLVKPSVGGEVYKTGPGPDIYGSLGNTLAAITNFATGLTGHTGSGMRMYLYKHFFECVAKQAPKDFMNDPRYLAHVICHEFAHKILDTEDIEYGPDNCRQLAIDDPTAPLFNADSWACFYSNYTYPEMVL